MTSRPEEVIANVIEPWTGPDRHYYVCEAILEALEAAGYSVVLTGETEHVVSFTEDGFVVQHPLACRPNLFECHYNSAYFDGPPDELGSYRFRLKDGEEPELLERINQ